MDRPPPHHRVNDRPNGGSDHIVVGGAGVGDHRRMPPRWSNDSPRGGNSDFPAGSGGGGGGGRFHPYPKQEFGGNVRGGFHGGPDDGGFGPIGGPKRGFPGRGGTSPDFVGGNKFIKLFVGSVPRTATEEDIRPLFEEHGNVIEVALIRDRVTGQQQGFCFVKYGTMEEAERAIAALHNKCTLPGALAPLQVRHSDGSRERQEDKLFVASLNKRATEQEIADIFSSYGQVEDVYMMKDEHKQFRGCGFVRFTNRESASAAMNALHGTYVMKGCDQPLIVRFADPKRPRSDPRNGPAFGGPGFGPRSEAATVNGSKFDESIGGRMPPNAWRPDNQQLNRAPQAPNCPSGDVGNMAGGMGGGHQMNFPTSSQQGFNPSMPQFNPQMNNQQLLQMQKPPMTSQNLPPFQQHPNQQAPSSHSEVHSMQTPMQQGQIQAPQMANMPSHQSQPVAQQNHLGLSHANQQMMQRPMQQMPSQVPQALLQQQSQNLQSSFQSSQQAIFQLQQQLQLMQQAGINQQQISQNAKQQQTPWNGAQPSNVPVSAPAVSTTSMTVNTTSATPLTCNWTEHTSPHGIKYYYNSVTQESKWDKPEEYSIFEQQQQQQQKLTVQPNQQISQTQIMPNQQISQTQIPPNQQVPQTQMLPNQQLPHTQILPNQQLPQTLPNQTQIQSNQQMSQQLQAQMQLRQQAQMQLFQPPLQYQSTGVAGQPNIQNYNYAQLQTSNPVADAARGQQVTYYFMSASPTASTDITILISAKKKSLTTVDYIIVISAKKLLAAVDYVV